MASPEIHSGLKGGDLLVVKNVQKGRIVARAMYNNGNEVFATILVVFNNSGKRVRPPDSSFFTVPLNYPGLKVSRPETPAQGYLPDF